MFYLSKNQIIAINKNQVERFGGNFVPPYNLLSEDRIDYLLDAIAMVIFGEPQYPEVYQKAALYMFNIVTGHIFSDGNKRTGLQAALIFLQANQQSLIPSVSDQLLIDFTTEVASGKHTLESVQNWFKEHIEDSFGFIRI